jgi:PAS domain S-box-containing protein
MADHHRILIVEDEIAVARELEARLMRFGYVVTGIAASAHEAMASLAQARPDVVLVNSALGGTERHATAAQEIRQRASIPMVVLIASDDEATLQSVNLAGPFGYVVKPYADRELRMNIDMAICRVEMTAQAHELEERFFAVSIDMLCLLDFSGYFKRLSAAWESTLGFSRAELMSRPFIEFVHPDDRDRTLNQNKAVRGGGQARSFENRYRCKDGSYRWLHWNAAPDGERHVIYSVARDITDRKEAEEKRETLVRELQTALAEVKTLQAILPICAYCKKIRDDEDYWQTVEAYISEHTNSRFSHGICPACYQKEVEPHL